MSTRLRNIEKFSGTEAIDTKELFRVLNSFRKGDFTVRLPEERTGVVGKIYDALNEVIEYSERLANELTRVSEVVGKAGKLTHRAALSAAPGKWAQCIESVNTLVTDLVQPTSDFSRVIGAVAGGDLSQRMNAEID